MGTSEAPGRVRRDREGGSEDTGAFGRWLREASADESGGHHRHGSVGLEAERGSAVPAADATDRAEPSGAMRWRACLLVREPPGMRGLGKGF